MKSLFDQLKSQIGEQEGSDELLQALEKIEGEFGQLKQQRDELKDKVRSNSQLSAEDAAKIQRENDQLKAELEEVNGKLESQAKQQEKIEKAKQEAEAKLQETQSSFDQHLIDQHLTDSLAKLNVKSDRLPHARTLLKSEHQLALERGENGEAMVKAGDKALEEFLKDWSENDPVAKEWIVTGGGSGGDAKKNNGSTGAPPAEPPKTASEAIERAMAPAEE